MGTNLQRFEFYILDVIPNKYPKEKIVIPSEIDISSLNLSNLSKIISF